MDDSATSPLKKKNDLLIDTSLASRQDEDEVNKANCNHYQATMDGNTGNSKRKRDEEEDDTAAGVAAATPRGKTPRPDIASPALGAEAATPAETTPQAQAIITQTIDLTKLKQNWSTSDFHYARADTQRIKTNKVSHSPTLRGGDWVVGINGGATLSFVFVYKNEYYGLTVAHPFTTRDGTLNDVVKTLFKQDDMSLGGEFELSPKEPDMQNFKIGHIVSVSQSTNSAVFKFDAHIDVDTPLTVKIAPSLSRRIILPVLDSVPPPKGTVLVGFGARQRGLVTTVEIPYKTQRNMPRFPEVTEGSICLKGQTTERTSYVGDCASIFMDLNCNGHYFHTRGTKEEPWRSFGLPLAAVMRKHTQLGGTSETYEENKQYLLAHPLSSDKEDGDSDDDNGTGQQSFNIPAAKFNLVDVPPPPRQLEKRSFKMPCFVHTIPISDS